MTLFGNRENKVIADEIVKVRSFWSREDCNPYNWYPYKKGKFAHRYSNRRRITCTDWS